MVDGARGGLAFRLKINAPAWPPGRDSPETVVQKEFLSTVLLSGGKSLLLGVFGRTPGKLRKMPVEDLLWQ